MITPHDTAVVGGFFIEGLFVVRGETSRQGFVLDIWNQGCYELVYEVTRYAEYCYELAEAGGKATGGEFPGVYDYEVSSEFGEWFGGYIVGHDQLPSSETCRIKLLNLAREFFVKAGTDQGVLDEALMNVEFKP